MLFCNISVAEHKKLEIIVADDKQYYILFPKNIKDKWALNNPERVSLVKDHCAKFKKNTYTFAYQGKEDRNYQFGHADPFRFICAKYPQEAVENMKLAIRGYTDIWWAYRETDYSKKIKSLGLQPDLSHIQFKYEILSKAEMTELIILDKQKQREVLDEEIKSASNQMNEDIKPYKLMCQNIGYKPGTEKFADCVKDLYLKKLDAQSQTQTQTTITAVPKKRIDPSVWDDLLNISKGMSEGKSFTESLSGVGNSSSSSASKIQCFKTGERISGTNKICSYNCMGSEVVQNISSTSICALSIDLN